MKLTSRFATLIVALLLSMGAVVFAGSTALSQLFGSLSAVVDVDMPRLVAITHVRRLFRSQVVLERDHLMEQSDKEMAAIAGKIKKARGELLEQLATYERLMLPEDREAVAQLKQEDESRLRVGQIVLERSTAKDKDGARQAAKQHSGTWEKTISGLVTANETRLADKVTATKAVFGRARTTLYAVGALAALLAVTLGTVIFRGIGRAMSEIVDLNAGLEAKVRDRTKALAERERAMRLVLDNTGEGLLTVTLSGTLTGESSAAARHWFGEPSKDAVLSRYLFPTPEDDKRRLAFEIAFDQLAADILPWEVAVDQVARVFARDGRHFELDFRQVFDGDTFAYVLVMVRDISQRIAAEELERHAREQHDLIAALLRNKKGFSQCVEDCEAIFARLAGPTDLIVTKRDIHTLKGNAASFGFARFAAACHALEDEMETTGTPPRAEAIAELIDLWRRTLGSIEEFFRAPDKDSLDVDPLEHRTLVQSLVERQDYDQILEMVEAWSWHRAADHLTRLRAQAEKFAERLNKPVAVVVNHNDARIPHGCLDKFWPTLVHVVRNAIDHGIEPISVRQQAGKPDIATISICTRFDDARFVVEVSDDGPGIDFAMLEASARRKGLYREGMGLLDLVFLDGVSSREQVSEFSGRGVGLAATRFRCESADGRVAVETRPGRGTTFTFSFPKPIVKVGALSQSIERRWTLIPARAASQVAHSLS